MRYTQSIAFRPLLKVLFLILSCMFFYCQFLFARNPDCGFVHIEDDYPCPSGSVKELVFYEKTLENYLEPSISSGEVLFISLDPRSEGIKTITRHVKQFTNLEAIHFIFHGGENALFLGDQNLDAKGIRSKGHFFRTWKRSFSASGDIVFYQCNLAEKLRMRRQLRWISRLTGADVAASTDITGDPSQGGTGSWNFKRGRSKPGFP